MYVRLIAVLVACAGLMACGGACKESSDVLLDFDGDEAVLAQVTSVQLTLTVNGGTPQVAPIVTTGKLEPGATVLLSALATPTTPTYALTVDASLRNASGIEIATATTTATVGSHACNHVRLAVSADASVDASVVSSPVDASEDLPSDMVCIGSGLDEDGDGIDDNCDVCATVADADDKDGDGDGVPDACDPDVSVPDNAVKLFEPFNAMPSGWTGTFTVLGGSLELDSSGGCSQHALAPAGVGPNVAYEAVVTPTTISAGNAQVGIFVADVGNTARGISCAMVRTMSTTGPIPIAMTELVLTQGLVLADPGNSSAPVPTAITIGVGQFAVGVPRRLLLEVHDGMISCGLVAVTGTTNRLVQASEQVVPTNLYPGVWDCRAAASYASAFAVSYP
jgi:hypothetical protein